MNNAIQIALERFFYGFGASIVILTTLAVAIYLVYRKSKKSFSTHIDKKPLPKWIEAAEQVSANEQVKGKRTMTFGSALKSISGISATALAIGVFVYVWTIGISSYDGVVERKHSGKGYRLQISNYYIEIKGESYTIGENLYKNVQNGDILRGPFCAPWTYINGKVFVYSFSLTLFGAFFGLLTVEQTS